MRKEDENAYTSQRMTLKCVCTYLCCTYVAATRDRDGRGLRGRGLWSLLLVYLVFQIHSRQPTHSIPLTLADELWRVFLECRTVCSS
jgi:hypothetical protein